MRMMLRSERLRIFLLVLVALVVATSAQAEFVIVFDTPISDDPVDATVTLSDRVGGDGVDVSISIPPGAGDLLGLFGNVADASLVDQLAIDDPGGIVTQWQFAADGVWKVGGGNTMSPVKNWDWGVKLGATGSSSGSLTAAEFGLTAPGLSVESLLETSNQGYVLGVRIQNSAASKLGLSDRSPVLLRIEAPEDGALLAASPVQISGRVAGDAPLSLEVDGTVATVSSQEFTVDGVDLAEGANTLVATATNAFAVVEHRIEVTLDTEPPLLRVETPVDGDVIFSIPSVLVTGTASDPNGIARVTVNGAEATRSGTAFSFDLGLDFGPNVIEVVAEDGAGNQSVVSLEVQRGVPPIVQIDSPPAASVIATPVALVTGQVSGLPEPAVDVNGVVATVSGAVFSASVALSEGSNLLTTTATNAVGTAVDTRLVVLDSLPPTIAINVEEDGATTTASNVTVSGTVADASDVVRVEVAGMDVALVGDAFSATVDLLVGVNTITVEAEDALGNVGLSAVTVERTGEPPSLVVDSPVPGLLINFAQLAVAGVVSGDPPLDVDVNGVVADVDAGIFSAVVPLVEGTQDIVITATNPFGQVVETVSVDRDRTPPTIVISTPSDGQGVTSETVTVTGDVSDASGIVALTVDGRPATVSAGAFSLDVGLSLGPNEIVVSAVDGAGNAAEATLAVEQGPAPTLAIDSPKDGQTLAVSPIRVVGAAAGVDAVTVNGVSGTVENGRFSVEVPLVDGQANLLVAEAQTPFGAISDQVEVFFGKPPVLSIVAPADGAQIDQDSVVVSGTVDDGLAAVEVNGIAASVGGDSPASFSATVPIFDGANLIAARAVDAQGDVSLAMITVIRDLAPPRISIELPADGADLTEPTVTVSGSVRDFAADNAGTGDLQVAVNGVSALVLHGRFSAEISLSPGSNSLVAVATDPAGNTNSDAIDVTFAAQSGGPTLERIGGGGQSGVIGAELVDPIRVRLADADGAPLANEQIVFRITKGNGRLDPANASGRALVTRTDAAGVASAVWSLGTRAGVSSDVVEVVAPAIGAAPLTFLANASAGPPAMLSADSGDNQVGVIGSPLPLPFVVVSTDAGHNRLPGVEVTFAVEEGGGSFDGASTTTVTTDRNGRAVARLTLGPDEGVSTQVATASLATGAGLPARFTASAALPGAPAVTAVSGVVLDNSDLAVPGVTVSVAGTPLQTVTDSEGFFRIAGVPPGPIVLDVDGSTATRPGDWVRLEFQLTAISGVENGLGRPVYLLPINPVGVFVDETQGGTLTLSDVPGFALEITPGSGTFPDGSRSGDVTVTVVHPDKVPMVPQFGQQPRLVVSIQPANALFEPPARLTIPNVDGLEAGEVTELYSFDHDLERFVSIGTGTVSEDRSVIVSDPGVGILEAGWHAGGPPVETGDAENTNVDIDLVADPQNMIWNEGTVGPGTVPFEAMAEVEAVDFGPTPGSFEWTSSDPSLLEIVSSDSGPDASTITVEAKAVGRATISSSYAAESGTTAQDSVDIDVATPDVTVVSWIDADLVPVPFGSGENERLVSALDGVVSCNTTLLAWQQGRRVFIETEADQTFANSWLVHFSANSDPGPTIEPEALISSGNFRAFNRFSFYFEERPDGTRVAVPFATARTVLGRTPPPCTLASALDFLGLIPTAAELHPTNGRQNLEGPTFWQLAQGRLGAEGQAVNRTVNAPEKELNLLPEVTPFIWTVVQFDENGQFTGLGSCGLGKRCSFFPTHSVYVNGERVDVQPQAPINQFADQDASFQLDPSEIE